VISPKLAAIGVATLSGLILKQRETTITAAVIKPAEEAEKQHCRCIPTVIMHNVKSKNVVHYNKIIMHLRIF
jgi:hypothetical protein